MKQNRFIGSSRNMLVAIIILFLFVQACDGINTPNPQGEYWYFLIYVDNHLDKGLNVHIDFPVPVFRDNVFIAPYMNIQLIPADNIMDPDPVIDIYDFNLLNVYEDYPNYDIQDLTRLTKEIEDARVAKFEGGRIGWLTIKVTEIDTNECIYISRIFFPAVLGQWTNDEYIDETILSEYEFTWIDSGRFEIWLKIE